MTRALRVNCFEDIQNGVLSGSEGHKDQCIRPKQLFFKFIFLMTQFIVPIYHRIGKKHSIEGDYGLKQSEFEKHLVYFREHFKRLDLLNPHLQENQDYFVLTVDDGWVSFLDNGIQLINEYRIPTIIHVNPGFIYKLERPSLEKVHPGMNWASDRYMNGTELKEVLKNELVYLGCHGTYHRNLFINRNRNVLSEEIVEGKRQLENRTGDTVASFAFPRCRYNRTSLSLAKKHYEWIFTLNNQINTLNLEQSLPKVLTRVDCSQISLDSVKTKMSSAYQLTARFVNYAKRVIYGF